MVRFKENRRSLIFSLLLLLLTYGVEGWIYGSWMNQLLEREVLLQFAEPIRLSILYIAAIVSITLIVFLFTFPVSLMTVSLNGWLKSDSRAFVSIFLGAFAFAILVQRIDYLTRFLVLLSAVFLSSDAFDFLFMVFGLTCLYEYKRLVLLRGYYVFIAYFSLLGLEL